MQNAVLAVAIVAELIWLVGHAIFGTGPMYATTPRPLAYRAAVPPSGRDVLLDLATTAAAKPQLTPTDRTPYAYVKTIAWHLKPRTAVTSKAFPTVTESWLKTDGTGRIRVSTADPRGSRISDRAVPAGNPLPVLPANEQAVARWLASGYPPSDGPAGQFVAFTALADREPISPPVEAAILRTLARIPGLVNSGTVTDRDGRPGFAVSVVIDNGVLTNYTLIFDHATGRLLDQEETLIGSPKTLKVRVGAVLAYTTFLASGYVAATSASP